MVKNNMHLIIFFSSTESKESFILQLFMYCLYSLLKVNEHTSTVIFTVYIWFHFHSFLNIYI